MKSLSPNAQEFVPYKPNKHVTQINTNVPLILINSDNKTQQQQIHPQFNNQHMMHSYMPTQQQYIPYQPNNYDQQPVLAFNNFNDLNNYMLKQQQQPVQQQQSFSVSPIQFAAQQPLQIPRNLQVQNISPTQSISQDTCDPMQQIPHHHHMQASIIPLATSPAFYAFTPQTNLMPNFIDPNTVMMNQFNDNVNYSIVNNNNNNKINQPKRAFNNNNNKIMNKKISNNKSKIEVTDKEWPSLVGDQEKVQKTNHQTKPNNIQEDDEITQPKTPYLDDEIKLKKLIKNVDFIKKTVEEHYNLNERKFTFKDAILAKPVINKPVVVKLAVKEPVVNTAQATAEPTSEKEEETSSGKKHRKRNRSKKNALKKQDTLTDEDKQNQRDFDLNKEDFPDLSTNSDKKRENKLSLSLDNEKKNFQSDAYSSDATLDAGNLKTSKNQVNEPMSGKKKLHKPIIVEFANMISALEKGVQNESKNLKTNKPRSKSQISAPTFKAAEPTASKTHNDIRSLTNPLDSCPPEQKRGKEREKPKQKKPSTLKKIILKEREEKRMLREQQANMNGATYPLEIFDLNSPIAGVATQLVLNEEANVNKTIDHEEEEEEEDEENSSETESDDDDDEEESDDEDTGKVASSTESSKQETQNENSTNNLTINASNPMSPISQGSPISLGGYTPTTYATLSMLTTDRTLLSLEKLEEQVKQKIHNKKFREYCNQITNKEIDEVCSFLLHEIVRFQDRLYHKNPVKAKTKRRYVMGIREVTKHLKLHKLKCVILAPNCEKIQSKGGLDDAINQIIQTAMEQNVPFVFALGRKGLGKAVNKLVPISVVGIFDYSGAEEYFKRLVELANNAKLAYQEIVEEYEKEECENLIMMQTNAVNNMLPTDQIISAQATPGMISTNKNGLLVAQNTQYNHHLTNQQIIQLTHNPIIPSHMGHSRNSSTGSNISIEPFAYHMNYHTHSRSASGNFNFGQTNAASGHVTGHSRSASGGNSSILNIDFGAMNKHWTHSRTPSNCSNISFISRLSEPISEVGSVGTLLINNSSNNLNSFNSASNSNLAPFFLSNSNNNLNQMNNNSASLAASLAAVQYYTEQVRQEMREQTDKIAVEEKSNVIDNQQQIIKETPVQTTATTVTTNINAVSSSLVNLHLGCIDEIDAGNEADTEADEDRLKNKSVIINETSES